MIKTLPPEPSAAPWEPRSAQGLLGLIMARVEPSTDRPTILAVDGRQGAGKTTVASRLAALVAGSCVVHSDDVAWWESFFGWDRLMAQGILEPLHLGRDVDFQPPAWKQRGRDGSIVVSATSPLVIIEGVGVSRRSLLPLVDVSVWVQSDWEEANRRGIARDGAGPEATDFWWAWDREERPFLAADRPWERADLVICGTPDRTGVEFDAATELLVGRAPLD